MIQQILLHTPIWVWALLAALMWLGFNQTFTRTVSIKRMTITPLAMVALSLYGTVNAFGANPPVLLAWLLTASLLATLVLQQPLPQATHYNGATRHFVVPGSWVPLVLIVSIFMTKYVVGASLAMHAAWAQGSAFGVVVGALYGAFSGVFLGRAARLWRLAYQADAM